MKKVIASIIILPLLLPIAFAQGKACARDLGIPFEGIPQTLNAITDVRGEINKKSIFGSVSLAHKFEPEIQPKQNLSGPITITVDATDAPRKIFHARLAIPVTPGPLRLFYPKWIPGEHGPTGPIINLAGLKMAAQGKTIRWQRDAVDMYVFHCQVPVGVDTLEVELDFLAPSTVVGAGGGSLPSTTMHLAVINWYCLLLYPQGRSDDLTYTATLRIPEKWKYSTALPVARESKETIEFKPVSLTELIDSPVIAGTHFRSIALNTEQTERIDLFADNGESLTLSQELIEKYRRLFAETTTLFGIRHYRSYRCLVALSNTFPFPFGLEHREGDDDRLPERAFVDEDLKKRLAFWLPHGLVHNWNGVHHRPASLTTSDFNQPTKGDLIWVYEGLTTYLCEVLTARSGLWTEEEYRENLAAEAAQLEHRAGRLWRSLLDTSISAQLLISAPDEWANWRRADDFYNEGALIWMETDIIIRQQSRGRRSLDDFCRLFFGGKSSPSVKTYTFDDLLTALNEVSPYDWRAFFTDRLNSTGPGAPLGGIEGSGWRLVYNDSPNAFVSPENLNYSIGLRLSDEGIIVDAIPGMVAAKAGIAPGMKLVAVNGRRWSAAVLREALSTVKETGNRLELLVENGGFYQTIYLDYRGGEKYPHLERKSTQPNLLMEIVKPLIRRAA